MMVYDNMKRIFIFFYSKIKKKPKYKNNNNNQKNPSKSKKKTKQNNLPFVNYRIFFFISFNNIAYKTAISNCIMRLVKEINLD